MKRLALRQWGNERLSIWNGTFATLGMSVVNGFVAMYLLDGLHATNAEMGLLNSLPALVNLFSMLAAAFVIGRIRSKKRFCAAVTSVSRSFYLWIALVPLLPVSHAALWVVWCYALIRVPQSFGDLSWQALISDLIAERRRSAFFSERNRVLTLMGLVATFITGYILQQFDKHALAPYQCAFAITLVFAVAEIVLLLYHDDAQTLQVPLVVDGVSRMGWSALKEAYADLRFRLVVIGLLVFNFSWQLAWPLFNIYQIHTAHAPALWVSLFAVSNQLSQVFTFRWWGRKADRHGNGPMLAIAAVGMALAPILTVLSTNLTYLVAVNFITGIPVAGTTLLLFNYLLEACPDRVRTTYIAYYNVILSVVGFVAPMVGVWLLSVVNMEASMVLDTALRLASAGVVWWIVWWLKEHYHKGKVAAPVHPPV